MQELVPERLFSGGVQLIVIGVKYAPRRLDLTHRLDGLGQGRHRPGPLLQLIQRQAPGRIQNRLRPFGELPRAHRPVSNPFFRHG